MFKAWFENVIALTTLMRNIAEAISKKTGKEVRVGRYVDISDSLHIYGSYFREIEGDPENPATAGELCLKDLPKAGGDGDSPSVVEGVLV